MQFKPTQPRIDSQMPHSVRGLSVVAIGLPLQGCALRGAPSYEIFGAYFPLWLLSAVLGVVAALVAHRMFVVTGWAQIVPLPLSVCMSIGLMIAALVWLSCAGQLI